MNGILIIDKPEGFTSHDVVARLRRILRTKKIGHTGTLDPFATGVLVMLVGNATRLARFLDKDEKSYEAIVRFGFETDTGDRTGQLKIKNEELKIKSEESLIMEGERGSEGARERQENQSPITNYQLPITKDQIEAVLPEFRGEIEQVPPMYSAKKVKGKKLYELARKGVEVERQPVKVRISELKIKNEELKIKNEESHEKDSVLSTQYPVPNTKDSRLRTQDSRLLVTCSAGTYIRTLAEDIGRKVGVPCHLAELRRTKAGQFGIDEAVTLEELEKIVETEKLAEILVSMNDSVSHLPERRLSEDELKKIRNGMSVSAEFEDGNITSIRLTDPAENLAAIGEYDHEKKLIQPRIVFPA